MFRRRDDNAQPTAAVPLPDVMARAVAGNASLVQVWRDHVERHFEETYAGVRISKFPEDLAMYEHLLWHARPDVLIELGTQWGGSALWFRDRLFSQHRYLGGRTPLVISADLSVAPAREAIDGLGADAGEGIVLLEGDLHTPELSRRVDELVADDAVVLVIEDARHDDVTTLACLQAFAPMVRPGGFYMVEDTCVDVEPLRYEESWPRGCGVALQRWLSDDPFGAEFVRRPDLQPYGITCHPGGLIQRLPEGESRRPESNRGPLHYE